MEHGHGAHMPSGAFGESFAPYARERLKLEDAAAQVILRRSRAIWALIAALAVLGFAALVAVGITSAQKVQSQAYAAVQSADEQHARKFLSCVLPGMDIRQATTPARLRSMLEQTSQSLGGRTAARIGQCLPELALLRAEAQRVRVLDDARYDLAGLQAATAHLITTWDEYQAFAASAPTDYANALAHMDAASIAWTHYQQRRDALLETLRPVRGR